jgi:acyl carrier protein
MREGAIASRVERLVAEVFNLPLEAITLQSSPETIEGWDSMGQLNLIIALEQEFGVQFSVEDVEKMVHVQGIIYAVDGRRGVR